MKQILIVNLARFGDIFQSLPMIQTIRRQEPDARISLLVNDTFSDVCTLLPGVNDYFKIDFRKVWTNLCEHSACLENAYEYLQGLFSSLRKQKYDRVINITPHYIGIYSSFLAGDESIVGSRMNEWQKYYINITRHWKTISFHLADLFTRIAGCPVEKHVPRLCISKQAHMFARELLCKEGLTANEHLIGFHIGASHAEKQWPLEYFSELGNRILDKIHARIILFGIESEAADGKILEQKLSGNVINVIGKTRVVELAALLSQTHVLVSNDSGPMHVAAACGTKIISIHTGKEKCFSTGPYGSGHIALQPRIACHPCEIPESCPTLMCRAMIGPGLVYSAVAFMLNGTNVSETFDCTHDLQQADVLVSRFDDNGYLDFYPLIKSEITMSVLSNRMLRFLWNKTLSPLSDHNEDNHDLKCYSNALVEQIKKFYLIESCLKLKMQWQNVDACMLDLCDMARQGIALADDIAQVGSRPLQNIKILQQLSERIEALDLKIISRGEALTDFATITHMFNFEKQKLDGTHIKDMVQMTHDIYQRLFTRCNVLHMLGHLFFKGIENLDV